MMYPNVPILKWRNGVAAKLEQEYPLYNEDFFRSMLRLEVIRSQRSRRFFILMLIDISLLLQDNSPMQPVRNVVDAVFSVTRETDLKGWFTSKTIVGILFLENNRDSENIIINKINKILKNKVPSPVYSLINVTTIRFPEEVSEKGESDINKWVKVYTNAAFIRSGDSVTSLN